MAEVARNDLLKIIDYQILRCITPTNFGKVMEAELHHFSHASTVAYAAVSYILARNIQDQVHCALMISKTRLAPIREITILRLELAAATLGIQLNCLLQKELELPIRRSTFWTASTTVIQYLRNDSKRFRTYSYLPKV